MKEVINTILLLLMVGWTAVTGSHSQESPKKQTALGVQQDYQIVEEPKVITAAQQEKIDADAALAQEVLAQASRCLAEGTAGHKLVRGCPEYNKVIATAGRTGVNWDRLANCETERNWQHQTKYDGGLGILHVAWVQFGGRDFAAYGSQATREEQIVVAERLYDSYRLSGWGCKAYG